LPGSSPAFLDMPVLIDEREVVTCVGHLPISFSYKAYQLDRAQERSITFDGRKQLYDLGGSGSLARDGGTTAKGTIDGALDPTS